MTAVREFRVYLESLCFMDVVKELGPGVESEYEYDRETNPIGECRLASRIALAN